MRAQLVSMLLVCVTASLAGAQVDPEAEHLLGRYGYGHDTFSRQRLATLGRRDYVEEQLHPEQVPDVPLQRALAGPEFNALTMSVNELWATYHSVLSGGISPIVPQQQVQSEMVLRALIGHRQLEALMTEFWFNHFNVDLGDRNRSMLVPYIRDTLRPHLFGKFEDLLLAVAHSPAMLHYLNNDQNFVAGFQRGGKTLGINENYARELMELHTFGVDDQGGVYTQDDVIALARALTGWTIAPATTPDGFKFLAAAHDTQQKTFLGVTLPAGGGEEEGVRAIHIIASRPRTAANLSRKLVHFLVGPGHPDLVRCAKERWLATGGNLRAVLRLILNSKELLEATDARVKRPLLLVASAFRSVNADLGEGQARYDRTRQIVSACSVMGQPLTKVEPPTGWEDASKTWLSEGQQLARFNKLFNWFRPGSVPTRFLPTGSDDAIVNRLEGHIVGSGGLNKAERQALLDLFGKLSTLSPADKARYGMAQLFSSGSFARY